MLGQCKSTEEGAVHSLPGVESTEEAMLEVGLAVLGGGRAGEGSLVFPPAIRWHFRKANSISKDLDIKCPGDWCGVMCLWGNFLRAQCGIPGPNSLCPAGRSWSQEVAGVQSRWPEDLEMSPESQMDKERVWSQPPKSKKGL